MSKTFERRSKQSLYVAVMAMVLASVALFFATSALSEDKEGALAGMIVSALTAVIFYRIARFYMRQVMRPNHQLILVAMLILQVTPFLFGGIYGAFGFDDTCISGATNQIDALYFSYTTFTTVGYGDLTPVGYCRIVSSVQGVSGYLLLGALGAALYAVILEREKKTQSE